MIVPIVRTAVTSLRRDRPALALSFLLPIAFFSIFAIIFGGNHDSTGKIKVILVDEDHSKASQQLMQALAHENSLVVSTRPPSESKSAAPLPDYTATTAEAAVKTGNVPVALIIPHGFGANPISLGDTPSAAKIQLLNDASDQIAPQMVSGLLQKAAMTAMPTVLAEVGSKKIDQFIGGFTPEQRTRMDANLNQMRQSVEQRTATGSGTQSGNGGLIAVASHSVVGENKSMIAFYAAAIGVMFLLFTASNSAGALLDEAESGALDRVLSSQVTMTSLLAGKLAYNTMLAFLQLIVMFLWAWAVFKLNFFTFTHLSGFLVMGISTAFAVAAFGMLLASLCRTRSQLSSLASLLILTMSAIGGSMFPRFLMPSMMQKAGYFTLNAWAIDGFTKVFWRDLPIPALWPQVGVLLASGTVLFAMARKIARRWECV